MMIPVMKIASAVALLTCTANASSDLEAPTPKDVHSPHHDHDVQSSGGVVMGCYFGGICHSTHGCCDCEITEDQCDDGFWSDGCADICAPNDVTVGGVGVGDGDGDGKGHYEHSGMGEGHYEHGGMGEGHYEHGGMDEGHYKHEHYNHEHHEEYAKLSIEDDTIGSFMAGMALGLLVLGPAVALVFYRRSCGRNADTVVTAVEFKPTAIA